MAKISKKEKKDAGQATRLFLTLFGLLFFIIVSIGIIGPAGMSAANTYIVALSMTFVFVIVPVVTVKMIASAWKDIAEHIVHKSDL